jgi:hypothetical protein
MFEHHIAQINTINLTDFGKRFRVRQSGAVNKLIVGVRSIPENELRLDFKSSVGPNRYLDITYIIYS